MHASKTGVTPSSAARSTAVSTAAASPATIARRFGNDNLRRLLSAQLHQPNVMLQAKLEVSRTDDPLEREADKIAEYVQGHLATAAVAGRPPSVGAHTGPTVQRKCAHCDDEPCSECEEESRHASLQRNADSAGPGASAPAVDAAVESSIVSSLGRGATLPESVRGSMEQSFASLGMPDVDFSGVRVHTGSHANWATREVAARAFAVGRDLFFRDGEYQPGSRVGLGLLAHELTHVVQQGAGKARVGATQVQRKPGGAGTLTQESAFPFADTELNEAHQAGLKLSSRAEIDERVKRTFRTPDPASLAQGRQDYKANPGAALRSLQSAHFRSDEARLSYAMGVFREQFGFAPGSDELFVTLRDFAFKAQTQASDLIVHDPPTAPERGQIESLLEARENELYELYLAEVEREKQSLLLVNGTGVYSGAHDIGIFDQFIGNPLEDLFGEIVEKAPAAFSLALDFVPIVGQVKGLLEGIIGQDLITGEELATWQRGLSILLAVLPEAKGVFSAGRAGVRALAKGTVKAGASAQKVWRIAKVASRLSASEIRAAMDATKATGRRRVAQALAEMAGDEGTAAARPFQPLRPLAEAGSTLGGLPTVGVTLGRQSHSLMFGRIGRRIGVVLCSECGLLIDKAAAMLNKLEHGHPLSSDLRSLIKAANEAERWVGKAIRAGGSKAARAQQELQNLASVLSDIERRYPGELLREVASGVASADEVTRIEPFPRGGSAEARTGVEVSSEKAATAQGHITPKPRAPKPAAPEPKSSVIVDESLGHETHFPDEEPTLDIKPPSRAKPASNSAPTSSSTPAAKPTLNVTPTSETALLQEAVGRARQDVVDVLDQQGARRGVARGAEHLSPECMSTACGLGRRSVARTLMEAGVPDSKIFMNQVADIAGTGRHVFAVVEIVPGRHILIDTTFAQFTGAIGNSTRVGEHLLTQAGKLGRTLRKELLEKGYIELNNEIANLYVKVVSEWPRGAYTLRDLIRNEVSLARNPHLLGAL
jgi:hypothetical protein